MQFGADTVSKVICAATERIVIAGVFCKAFYNYWDFYKDLQKIIRAAGTVLKIV